MKRFNVVSVVSISFLLNLSYGSVAYSQEHPEWARKLEVRNSWLDSGNPSSDREAVMRSHRENLKEFKESLSKMGAFELEAQLKIRSAFLVFKAGAGGMVTGVTAVADTLPLASALSSGLVRCSVDHPYLDRGAGSAFPLAWIDKKGWVKESFGVTVGGGALAGLYDAVATAGDFVTDFQVEDRVPNESYTHFGQEFLTAYHPTVLVAESFFSSKTANGYQLASKQVDLIKEELRRRNLDGGDRLSQVVELSTDGVVSAGGLALLGRSFWKRASMGKLKFTTSSVLGTLLTGAGGIGLWTHLDSMAETSEDPVRKFKESSLHQAIVDVANARGMDGERVARDFVLKLAADWDAEKLAKYMDTKYGLNDSLERDILVKVMEHESRSLEATRKAMEAKEKNIQACSTVQKAEAVRADRVKVLKDVYSNTTKQIDAAEASAAK